jgi:hypothetical protein
VFVGDLSAQGFHETMHGWIWNQGRSNEDEDITSWIRLTSGYRIENLRSEHDPKKLI